ncbi:MAG: anaerobic glycerol-3-phosphate dehydrogenase subunit A, partial [Thermodesulfobacteriota bacterium]
GLKNLITITGGKLITYRLMAEKVSDLICEKMGAGISCSTHLNPLPGAAQPSDVWARLKKLTPSLSKEKTEILCDCELVERNEIEKILTDSKLKEPLDILHRTRLAKGTCQGGFCLYRLLGVLHEMRTVHNPSNLILKRFLEERWKGIRPVLWGDGLKEEELIEGIYKGIFNL